MDELLLIGVVVTLFVVHWRQELARSPHKVPQGTGASITTQLEQMGAVRKSVTVDKNGDLVRHEVFHDEVTGIVIKRLRKVKPLV